MHNQDKRFKVAATHATEQMTLSLYEIMWICYYLESIRGTIERDDHEFICRALTSVMKNTDKSLIKLAVEYVAASMNYSSRVLVFSVEDWLHANGHDWGVKATHDTRKLFLDNMITELSHVLKEHQYPF